MLDPIENDDFAEEDWDDVSADLEAMDRQDADEDDIPCMCGQFDCPECGDGTLPEFDDKEEFDEED